MESKNLIYELITLELTNGLDKQQKEELQSWIGMSMENRAEYDELVRLLTFSDRLIAMKRINADQDLLLVKKKMNRKGMSKTIFLIFQKAAAILIIPLLLYTVWNTNDSPEISKKKNMVMKSSETSFGVRSQIELSDGTKVWINSGSKLTYPEEFSGNSREVKLVGEAYFQVKSDNEHPFYVDLKGFKVKATGTRFNISNYPEDKEISTFLEQGKISFLLNSEEIQEKSMQLLNEKELIIVNKAHKQFRIQKTDDYKYLAWIDGALIFKNDNTSDVAVRLGRWFNAEVIIDEKLSKSGYVFTATFKKESLEEALRLLSFSSPITYKIISGTKLDDSSFSKRKVIISKK